MDVVLNPSDNVVLEGSLDKLMEDIGRQEFVDISTGEVAREGLESCARR